MLRNQGPLQLPALGIQESREVGAMRRAAESGQQVGHERRHVAGRNGLLAAGQAGFAHAHAAAKLQHIRRRQTAVHPSSGAEQPNVGHWMPSAGVRATADADLQVFQPVEIDAPGRKCVLNRLRQTSRQTDSQAAGGGARARHHVR